MAVTITNAEIAVAIRAAATADSVPAPIATVLSFLAPAATAMILHYAPDAPDAMHNAALIRLAGWLYDADPTDSRISDALTVSGAANLLSQWRAHRAGIITATGETPGGGGIPTGAGLPPLPETGHFILTVDNGALKWVAFPPPQ